MTSIGVCSASPAGGRVLSAVTFGVELVGWSPVFRRDPVARKWSDSRPVVDDNLQIQRNGMEVQAQERVEFGVITGVGLSEVLRALPEIHIDTPFGAHSGPIRLASINGRSVALIARRGEADNLLPHAVPYRANIWAFASLGVRTLVTSAASSGLRDAFPAGTFVIPDQLIDLTHGRAATFFDGEHGEQVSAAEPFDPTLRSIAAEVLAARRVRFRDFGTIAVTAGPHFPTLAESRWHASMGADLSNMTLQPETTLAIELGMAVLNMSFITGTDLSADRAEAVNLHRMQLRIRQAATTFSEALYDFIDRVPRDYAPQPALSREAIEKVLDRPVLTDTSG